MSFINSDVFNSLSISDATVDDQIICCTNVAFKVAEVAYDKYTAPGKGMNDLQRTALNAKIAEIRSKWADGSEVAVPTSWGESACRWVLKGTGMLNKTLGERVRWLHGETLKAAGGAAVVLAAQKANENPLQALLDIGIGAITFIVGRVLTHGLNVAGRTLYHGAHSREHAEIEAFIQSNEITKLADK